MNGSQHDDKKKSDAQKDAEEASRITKEKEQIQLQSNTQQPKQQDKSRPVSSTPISGTPWYIFSFLNDPVIFISIKLTFKFFKGA